MLRLGLRDEGGMKREKRDFNKHNDVQKLQVCDATKLNR